MLSGIKVYPDLLMVFNILICPCFPLLSFLPIWPRSPIARLPIYTFILTAQISTFNFPLLFHRTTEWLLYRTTLWLLCGYCLTTVTTRTTTDHSPSHYSMTSPSNYCLPAASAHIFISGRPPVFYSILYLGGPLNSLVFLLFLGAIPAEKQKVSVLASSSHALRSWHNVNSHDEGEGTDSSNRPDIHHLGMCLTTVSSCCPN